MTDPTHVPNLDGLMELARRDGVDVNPTLLRVMTDLYVQEPTHTAEQERQFTELVLDLIDRVDQRTSERVATKIAGYANAPAALRHHLLRTHIKVDATVPPLDIRPPTTPAAGELSELFFAANAEERRLILLNLPYAPLQPAEPMPPAMARESVHRLEAAALGHNGEVFARELARMLSVSREHARRLIDDVSGEPIVVAAVALGMPASVLQRILLCLNPQISQSVQRVYELALLHEEIDTQSALQLVAVWQASHPAARPAAPVHQPQHVQTKADKAASPVERLKIRWDEIAQARKESA
jgi:hypothetical protein